MQAPALRPAGKPERETGHGAVATTEQDTALPQAPRAHGPPTETDTNPGAGRPARAVKTRCITMATIRNLRDKIERMSALNGWRMRWHMQ
jgi:hypothetical protein